MLVLGFISLFWSYNGKIICLDEVIKLGFLFENVEIYKGSVSVE